MDLRHSDFSGADLRDANFAGANLELANFQSAILTNANFKNANVKAAIFRDAVGLSDETRADLTSKSQRWFYDARTAVQWVLDSLVFPAILLILFPLAAVVITLRSRRRRRPAEASGSSPLPEAPVWRFRLSTPLWVMAAVGVVVGIGVWSLYALYSLFMVTAFYLIVAEAVYFKRGRAAALALLVTNVLYAVAGVGLTFAVKGASFGPMEMMFAAVVLVFVPLLFGMVVVIVSAMATKRIPWLAILGFLLSLSGVVIAFLWLLVQMIASV